VNRSSAVSRTGIQARRGTAPERREPGMFVLVVLFGSYKLCSAVAFYLRVYAPTNIALDYFRSRRGLKWALPAALVLTPTYWGVGYAVTNLIENGGPGWLNLVAALLAWNGLKFAMSAAWSPVLLAVAALRQTRPPASDTR
jgi:hypothetical protein